MDSPGYGSFGAFTMIKAEKLEYKTVTQALLDGHFYASQGPEIYSLTFEDGEIHIVTSPATKITMESGARYAGARYATKDSGMITEATFAVVPDCDYVRFTVFDPSGREVKEYAANVTVKNGKASFTVPFALSDAAGVWQVKIREVISGKVIEVKINR